MVAICYVGQYKQTFKIHNPSLLVVFKEINEKYPIICFETSKRHEIKKWQSTKLEI